MTAQEPSSGWIKTIFSTLKNLGRRTAQDPRDRIMAIGLGSMKSGTTWLSDYLSSHPAFLHSPVKEMNVFNTFAENPFGKRDEFYRLMRMEETILGDKPLTDSKTADRLRALAQIGRIAGPESYLAYFAERLQDETHFGEISPSYSHLPVETLRLVAGMARDVRFLFLMRDPAKRAASHIRHLRRRLRADTEIKTLIAEVAPGNPVWMRSDYGYTLDRLEEAGLLGQSWLMVYETLFKDETARDLCDWLGLAYRKPRPDRVMNAGRGEDVTPAHIQELRERLDPLYRDLARRTLPEGAKRWQWS